MANKGKPKKRGGSRPAAKRPIPAGPGAKPPAARSAPKAAAPAGAGPAGGDSGDGGRGGGRGGGGGGGTRPPRSERLEAARRARRRKQLGIRAAVVGGAGLVLVAIVATIVSNRNEAAAFRERLTAGSCTFDTRNDPTSAEPNSHVPPASYRVNPPAGGNHDPAPAPAGVFDGEDVPTDQQVVHSLEHGYIAIWHRAGLPDREMAAIRRVFDRYDSDVLVLPRPSLPSGLEVAATAWGERLLCRNIETGPLTEFVKEYRNEGPEKVSHE